MKVQFDITVLPASKRPLYKVIERALKCRTLSARGSYNVVEVSSLLKIDAELIVTAFQWADNTTGHNQITISTCAGLNSIVVECSLNEFNTIVTAYYA